MDDPLKKLGQSTQKIVQCRICKGDHWTTKCPYKDRLEVIQAQVKEDEAKPAAGAGNASLLYYLHVLSITLSAFNKHRRPTKSVGYFAQRSRLLFPLNLSN